MTHVVALRLVNWSRFRGEHVLALGPGTYAVTAQDADDEGRSNWLGKSALLGALRWALEGHKPRTVDTLDELISHGEDHTGVEVELSDGTFISRLKKRGKPVDLEVETGCRLQLQLFKDQAQDEIWRVIGLTADDLLNTAYAEQKKLAALVDTKGTGLHDIVTGWLQLEPLVAAADASLATLATLSIDLKAAQSEVARWEAADTTKVGRELLEARIQELEAQAADTERRRKANAERIREHDAWLVLKQKREEAERAEAEVARRDAELAALPQPEGDLLNLDTAVKRATQKMNEAEADYRQKRALAAGLFSGQCPVNGEHCPITLQINAAREKNARLVEASEQAKTLAQLAYSKALAPLSLNNTRAAAIERATIRLQQARETLSHLAKLLDKPLPPEPDVVVFFESIGVAYELDTARRALAAHMAAVDELARATVRVDYVAPKVRVARAAAAVLGPEGAQRRIAERAVQAIERTANADLAAAGIDLTLAVRWGRETQQPARQCPQCGTAFPASTRVKTCEGCLAPRGLAVKPELRFRLSNVSGAAEDLAGLALRCSAFKWLRARRGAQWGLAVLDEPFGSLDRTNKRALSAHVQSMLAGTFDQALLVAHDAALLDGCQHRITITGRGKWSTVAAT